MKTSRDSRFTPAAPREGRSGLLHTDPLGGGRLAGRRSRADDRVPAPLASVVPTGAKAVGTTIRAGRLRKSLGSVEPQRPGGCGTLNTIPGVRVLLAGRAAIYNRRYAMRSRMAIMIVAAMLPTVLASPTGSAAAAGRAVYYVSLGDSAAAGVQPPGWNARGYADQLASRMRARLPQLRLVKLGCPGETSESLLSGTDSPCSYPSGSQLEEAVSVLRAHAGSVAFITINIGVNDVLNACLDDAAGALDPGCVQGVMPQVQANLAATLRTLGEAAPGVPIAGMSYWDPFVGFWITGPDGEARARKSN